MKKLIVTVAFVCSCLFTVAEPRPHAIDKAHSQINFIGEARFISAHGFFGEWDADVALDPGKIEDSKLTITIDAASLNTRVQMRDNHLRSKDFFAVDQYPKIVFVSKKINKVGERKYDVLGDLTLRGVTKEIDVPLTMAFYENGRGRFRGAFEINRKEYGISYDSKMNPIDDIVQVQVDINVIDKEAAEKARARR